MFAKNIFCNMFLLKITWRNERKVLIWFGGLSSVIVFPLLLILSWWQNEKRKYCRKMEWRRKANLFCLQKVNAFLSFCYIHFSSTHLSKPVSMMFLKSLQTNHLNIFSPGSFWFSLYVRIEEKALWMDRQKNNF